jgi:ABC-2 type transport system ATP-binding protein
VIALRQLSFRYQGAGRDAIQGLSLDIAQGSLFGLLGPNGSGKTTLISILCGLLKAGSGQVSVDAVPSLVPQDYAFYPRMSILENLEFFAGVQGLRGSLAQERIAEMLRISGLEENLRKRAEDCSGGMKRRLNIAIGLLTKPKLLFLDEPTVGIDPQSRHFILQAVRQINRQGCTVVYTSHYMEEVEELCDEIGILDLGTLLCRGSLKKLLGGRKKHKNLEELFMALTKRGLRD